MTQKEGVAADAARAASPSGLSPASGSSRSGIANAAAIQDTLRCLIGTQVAFIHHYEKAWASITFSGARHFIVVQIDLNGEQRATEIAAILPDWDHWTLPGQLVADATAEAEGNRLSIQLLVLENN